MKDSFLRLSKLMSELGLCSRREADRYIEEGQVLVNGEVITTLGTKVSRNDEITLKTKATRDQKNKVTILLHKPLGFVSTQPEKGYRQALDLITEENQFGRGKFQLSHLKKLSVAGRLDIDSKGLLLLTQDGTLVKKIIGPDADLEKEYLVGVEGKITQAHLEKLRFGLSLDGKPLKRAQVSILQPQLLKFVLREGKKRQIRRMCELVNLKVTRLKRVRIGNISLGQLPVGCWRYLEPHENLC